MENENLSTFSETMSNHSGFGTSKLQNDIKEKKELGEAKKTTEPFVVILPTLKTKTICTFPGSFQEPIPHS